MLLLCTGTLMYYMRPVNCDADCMDQFASIPRTLYLATLMLTGQGGPEGKLDTWTKAPTPTCMGTAWESGRRRVPLQVICSLTAIFSVAVFAIPASMLTWGFEVRSAPNAVTLTLNLTPKLNPNPKLNPKRNPH